MSERHEEAGWLIERNDGTQPHWLRLIEGRIVWVTDALTALRWLRS